MQEIVLNEKQWAEDALRNMTLGASAGETLSRLARYYHSQGYKAGEIAKMLEEFAIRCDSSFNIVKWQPVIDGCAKHAGRVPLISVSAVEITENEMEKIKGLPSVRLQRVMFALLCLAKYGNAINPQNNNWVNREPKDIFSLADVKVTNKIQALLINELWSIDYIGYSNIVDNINVQVRICDSDPGNVVMRVDDFRSLGNQYMRYLGEDYMTCEICGLVIKRNSRNQRYCKPCSIDINISKTMKRSSQAA